MKASNNSDNDSDNPSDNMAAATAVDVIPDEVIEDDEIEESMDDSDLFEIVSTLSQKQQEELSLLEYELKSADDAPELEKAIRGQVSDLTDDQINRLVKLEVMLFENDDAEEDEAGLKDVDLTSEVDKDNSKE